MAQARDPHAQVLKVVPVLRAPHLAQQFAAEDHLAGVGGEVLEQLPLGAGHRDLLAVAVYQPLAQVNGDVPRAHHLLNAYPGRAPQHRADPGTHLICPERLDDVVIRAQLQATHLIYFAVTGGDQDDRHRRPLAQCAQHLVARHFGHHHVEQDDVGTLSFGDGKRFVAARRCDHAKSLGSQFQRDQPEDSHFIIDSEYERFIGHCAGSIRRLRLPVTVMRLLWV